MRRYGANQKGRKAGPGDMIAQYGRPADIGAELNDTMHRNDGCHRNKIAHQGKQGDAAANADGDSQRRGEEAHDDQNHGGPGFNPGRNKGCDQAGKIGAQASLPVPLY